MTSLGVKNVVSEEGAVETAGDVPVKLERADNHLRDGVPLRGAQAQFPQREGAVLRPMQLDARVEDAKDGMADPSHLLRAPGCEQTLRRD